MARPTLLMTGAYPQWDLDYFEENYSLLRLWEAVDTDGFLAAHGASVRAVATRGDLGASADLIDKLPNLEIISVFGVGTDAVDLGAARARHVSVTNTPDVLTDDVADIAVALLLAAARQVPQGDALVRAGAWPQAGLPLVTRVSGKTVGIAGMGRIGAAVAKRLAAFDCQISYYARGAKTELPYQFEPSLLALARDNEFVIVTLAGGEGTKNIIDKQVIAALGPDGILVNVSRG